MKDDNLYIDQILDSIRKIDLFVKGKTKKKFLAKQETQSAVILQLALIGEVTKKLSLKFKNIHQLPWKEIAGFRDKAIHDYFSMDLDLVWDTVKKDIPPLKAVLIKSDHETA